MSKLLTVKEVAKHLGISVSAVKIRCSRGKIAEPAVRREGELFWTLESLRKPTTPRGCTPTMEVITPTPGWVTAVNSTVIWFDDPGYLPTPDDEKPANLHNAADSVKPTNILGDAKNLKPVHIHGDPGRLYMHAGHLRGQMVMTGASTDASLSQFPNVGIPTPEAAPTLNRRKLELPE